MGLYQQYLRSEHWQKLSTETKRKAGNRCQVCNSPHDLDVHHRTYSHLGHELELDVICLCHTCHEQYHFAEVEFTDEPLPPVVIFYGKSDSAWGTE